MVEAKGSAPNERLLNTRGLRELHGGDREAALATFSNATELYPDRAELHNNRGIVLQGLGRVAEATAAFERAVRLDPHRAETFAHLGNSYAIQAKTTPALAAFQRALALQPGFLEAHWAIYEVAQMQGDRELALEHQRIALSMQRLYTESAPPETLGHSVLMLCAPGDWQTNVPLEFVFNRATTTVHKYFLVDDQPPDPLSLPPYDVIFNAVAQSEEAEGALRAVERFIVQSNKPFLNDPRRVRESSRSRVRQKLSNIPGCLMARILRLPRESLFADALGPLLEREGCALPVLIRPVSSHAGIDLVKIDRFEELAAYLERVTVQEFYVCEFIDYRSDDGYFRKYRIMFVDGVPYACHLAISDRWMVHYYNALMGENAGMRQEEARFLEDFRNAFAPSLEPALAEIARRIGLEYFGIDCSLMPDGRILVFEADPAMIVHMSDPIDLFPYKHAFVPRILDALDALLERTAARAR